MEELKRLDLPKKGRLQIGLTAMFERMKPGEIKVYKEGNVKLASLRTRAAELNVKAGYTKYSVSIDRYLGTIRLFHNLKEES